MPSFAAKRTTAIILLVLLAAGMLFAASYYYDNKYAIALPRGAEGAFEFAERDLAHPLVLTDGWLFDLNGAGGSRQTFIGQYSNFSYVAGSSSPFGKAVYTLVLRPLDSEEPLALTLFVPEVYGDFALLVDGKPVLRRGEGSFASIVVQGETTLAFEVDSSGYYYSGLVYPPVLGTAQAMETLQAIRTLASGSACLVPLVLSAIAWAVWMPRRGDSMLVLFAGLCLAVSVGCFGPFAWQLGWSSPMQHALEDAAWISSLVLAAEMAARTARFDGYRWYRFLVRPLLVAAPAATLFVVGWGIPHVPAFIESYEAFQTVFRVSSWVLIVACAAAGTRSRMPEGTFILCGAAVLAVSFVAGLLDAGAYEPLYGLWQNEYAGLMLMGVFAAMIIGRGRRLVAQEAQLREAAVQLHAAEQTVAHVRASEERTRALRHDLKHHANALAALCEEDTLERARSYARDLAEGMAAVAPVRYSSNIIFNAALASYLASASNEGMRAECNVRVPEEIPMRDGDLAVLLANLLSNAVEGCERVEDGRERYIRFDAAIKGDALCLRCENAAPLKRERRRTSKRDALEHGFGLPVIHQIVNRYRGATVIDWQDGVYTVSCVLRIEAR